MKSIKAKTSFNLDGVYYDAGDEVICNDISKIVKMNEKGFIEPLSAKDLQNIKNEISKPKKIVKKEEE